MNETKNVGGVKMSTWKSVWETGKMRVCTGGGFHLLPTSLHAEMTAMSQKVGMVFFYAMNTSIK